MHIIIIPQIIAGLAIVFTLVTFGWRLKTFNNLVRPIDRAPARGSIKQGLLYAYTLGMAPWEKESTRRHWLSYVRGVFFHIGIFLGLGILVISPWLNLFPDWLRILLSTGAGVGAFLGLMGFIARFIDPNLKALSTPDDYFTVLVVSIFLASAGLGLSVLATLPIFYIISAFMLIYAPFSKIRHCIYFAYSRMFFGRFTGIRGVLPHQQQVVR